MQHDVASAKAVYKRLCVVPVSTINAKEKPYKKLCSQLLRERPQQISLHETVLFAFQLKTGPKFGVLVWMWPLVKKFGRPYS